MKVSIGKYVNFIGPYQIAEALCFWVKKTPDEFGMMDYPDWVHKFGERLAATPLMKLCNWIHSKRHRKVKVKLDPYDTWSADQTLAHIILPMLKQLKEQKQGSPNVDDEDVPENLRSTNAAPKEHPWDTDEHWFKRWDYVIDEMIWAFERHLEGDDKFYDHSQVDDSEGFSEQISKIKVDYDGLNAWEERKQNGFRLFGKYYQCLWS